MSVIAVIPARGGSKRVPRKNALPIGGKPLVVHTIEHALAASSVDEVIVSTDDAEVAEISRRAGATVVMRPAELAVDTATSESALFHVLNDRKAVEQNDPELVVFLQCTSPARRRGDIDAAVQTLREQNADSLLSVCRNTRFIWDTSRGEPVPINYDFHRRPREQDFQNQFYENGSIYVFKPDVFRRENNRLGGKKTIYEMGYWSSFQVDSPADARLCDWILRNFDELPDD